MDIIMCDGWTHSDVSAVRLEKSGRGSLILLALRSLRKHIQAGMRKGVT